jgi:hypothetical protein
MFSGPSTPGTVGSVIMILLAALVFTMAVSRGTRVGGAFMHGKGETRPINRASRVIGICISLVLLYAGLQGFMK